MENINIDTACEYLAESSGLDNVGQPRASVQVLFGTKPFSGDETDPEYEEKNVDVTDMVNSSVPVSLKITDTLITLTFDMMGNSDFFKELVRKITDYEDAQRAVFDGIKEQFDGNNEENLNKTKVPFMYVTVIPAKYAGDVTIGFEFAPELWYITSQYPGSLPDSLVMVFPLKTMFILDDENFFDGGELEADDDGDDMESDEEGGYDIGEGYEEQENGGETAGEAARGIIRHTLKN